MRLEILKYPDERLHQKSKPITSFDSELHQFLNSMAQTMYEANGVGLAAPQVGRFERFFIVDISAKEEPRELYEFINPTITSPSGKISFEEGCLSIPGISEEVTRPSKITVKYQNRLGDYKVMEAEELLAVAIQHEFDHLEGTLFIDKVSPMKRRFLKKKLSKLVTL